MPMPVAKGFWFYVNKTDGCWEWTGALSTAGYGRASVGNGRTDYAHRESFKMYSGADIPEGMFVCHHCDNPKCVRPDHLFLGTHGDNMRDMVRKGRNNAAQPARRAFLAGPDNPMRNPNKARVGSRHPHAKLNEAKAVAIMAEVLKGRPHLHICKDFGIARNVVHRIAAGKAWTHVVSKKDVEKAHLLSSYGMTVGWPP